MRRGPLHDTPGDRVTAMPAPVRDTLARACQPAGSRGGTTQRKCSSILAFHVVQPRFWLDDGDSVLDFAGWRTATGQDGSSLVAAPPALFVDPAARDYHLRAASPARDTG